MSAPAYAEFAPPPALADFVHCFWTFTGPADDAPQRIAPDGRPELIIHHGAPYAERTPHGDVAQPRVLFAGQLTQPLILVAPGAPSVVGVRFHPWAASAFLGRSADATTDRRVDIEALHGDAGRALKEEVGAASDLQRCVELAESYVAGRMATVAIDKDVRAHVLTLLAGKEPNATELSERQFQRRFKGHVGISPRMLQSVLRFRRVFDAIEHPETGGWVEAALAAGYFDQPQMARDFRRFVGCTAREWAAQRAGLATALAAAPDSYKK